MIPSTLIQAASLVATSANSTTPATDGCRCLPADDCWPSATEWSTLNSTVSGRLIATVPIGSPCHDPNYDAVACAALQDGWSTPELHFESSSSVMQAYFANQSCDPFTAETTACKLGNYASYAVDVSSTDDVVAALAFANSTNIRVVIRNTGHDFLGRSTGAGSLAVWTHHLKSTEVVSFSDEYYTGTAMKVGAGVQGWEAVEAASAAGLVVLSGECPTVGLAGGYTQGGGHSALSTEFGLGADQTLEFEVVTANGTVVTASRTQNTDLYWALSGGGGGTYGVVTSMTVRAYPDATIGGAQIELAAAYTTEAKFDEIVSTFHAMLPNMTDAGAMVVYYVTDGVLFVNPVTVYNSTADYVKNTVLAPFLAAAAELAVPSTVAYSELAYYDHYEAYMGPLPYGNIAAEAYQFGGRLVPRAALEGGNIGAFSAAIRNITSAGVMAVGSAGDYSGPAGVDNGVRSLWRDTTIAMQFTTAWDETAAWADMVAEQVLMTDTVMPVIEAATPGSGSYMNEADFRQADWQETFFGEKYDRLLEVKNAWDPENLFYILKGVGSEAWTVADDGRMCRA